jgi:hypothetical protein
MRQGNDAGNEYRSAIFVHDHAQRTAAEAREAMYQEQLSAAGLREITTEIAGPPAPPSTSPRTTTSSTSTRTPTAIAPITPPA